ncbi:cyclic nucleotide-binding protein [Methylobacterium sp. Leaf113]|uniref:cyclic nucleotide-binding domain-containing protein n=1 Tax=unclassified Methylobacterium TaxID=2615210 RepID=UPI0006F54A33|nr:MULTISPECIES: Crp/Fnr family transcriptional regulator [unclassified Methylobacterium]KQP83063.1 cyclic nucleotide-binding protein [Methylobacterium sp. Leaf117]KQP92736.1 cyclic nucleotide-binding protein [Methylobacterium sp. Leaf113]
MGLDDDIAILSAAPLFGFMARDALRLLSFAAERRSLGAGERLFAQGERADGGFVVMSGTLTLTPRGARAEPVTMGRSSLIGRLALFQRGERPCDADATRDAEVIRITPTLMRRVLEEFPDAARAIHADLSQDLAAFTTDLVGLGDRFDPITP